MPLKLTKARTATRRYLMPDTCTLIDPGADTRSDTGGHTEGAAVSRTVVCGFIDPRRIPEQERLREGVQIQARGTYIFRLPLGTAISTDTQIRFQGRLYEVVDPGPPVHGLALATYVGVEEIKGEGA